MRQNLHISYRDYDDDDFNSCKSPAIEQAKYNILLTQALGLQPQNEKEKEFLADYTDTLKAITECYEKISDAQRMIAVLNSRFDAAKINSLEETLKKNAALIYYREQDLFVLEHSNSGLLKRIAERNSERNQQKEQSHAKPSVKEKLANTFGIFGVILFFALRLIVSILPFVMIGGNFFLNLFLIAINTFVPFTSVVFWIWGLVCAIKGVQDFWTILYYIVFAFIWLPFFVTTIISAFSKEK